MINLLEAIETILRDMETNTHRKFIDRIITLIF